MPHKQYTNAGDMPPMPDKDAPAGAQYRWAGQYYRQGRHGLIFRWASQTADWVRCTVNLNTPRKQAQRLR